MDTVKIGKLPGEVKILNIVPGETTIEEAIEIAEIDVPQGWEIRVDNRKVTDLSATLTNGQQITILRPAKGN